MAATNVICMEDYGSHVRWIAQRLIPSQTPLLLRIVNVFSYEQLHFPRHYKVTGITVEGAGNGVLFGNYGSFIDVRCETCDRVRRTHELTFNPFTVEMQRYGRMAGDPDEATGRVMASAMVSMLGLITWRISEDPGATADVVSLNFNTTNELFGGDFKLLARNAPGGVILEDDRRREGGGDVRTNYLAMANLALTTHPRGFEQIAEKVVEEVTRARAKGVPYTGEIGPPSIELVDGQPTA
jgi:hypothetical protein